MTEKSTARSVWHGGGHVVRFVVFMERDEPQVTSPYLIAMVCDLWFVTFHRPS
jgi:hypothetical protein